jgi:peroxiredoxin
MIPNRWMNLLISIIILLSLVFSGGCTEKPVVQVGDIAQDFTLPSLDGPKITLSSFKGKNVFIFFWTQGCVFCQTRNIVLVNDVYLKGRETGLAVIAVNIAESKGDVAEFVRQKKLIFPVLMDKDASVTRKKFGVYVVPTLFIIDKNGVIKDKAYGYLTEKALRDFVNPYLKGKGS